MKKKHLDYYTSDTTQNVPVATRPHAHLDRRSGVAWNRQIQDWCLVASHRIIVSMPSSVVATYEGRYLRTSMYYKCLVVCVDTSDRCPFGSRHIEGFLPTYQGRPIDGEPSYHCPGCQVLEYSTIHGQSDARFRHERLTASSEIRISTTLGA